ncbi:unnamed protein product [Ambrosiozyma monospora]|uniref:Unnamed protein product n=1 Tax=Ambrosiozyma monospora TaxID=43982 RepID=A0ACB5TP52_AMBMO|nr:unnamed protein product [Ambrosiozyma monospora]
MGPFFKPIPWTTFIADAIKSNLRNVKRELSLPDSPSSGPSFNLSDPAQKAVWSEIGKTIAGNIAKRDYEQLTEEQRKGLGTAFKNLFGVDELKSQDIGVHKREDAVGKVGELLSQLASHASASASASIPAVTSTTIAALL